MKKITDENLFPIASEEALLGAILIGGVETLREVVSIIQPTDFGELKHQWIYSAMLDLERSGSQIDHLTVGEMLRIRGKLDDIGGVSYLTYLGNQTPTHIHALTYAESVLSGSRRRRANSLAAEMATASRMGRYAEILQIASKMQQELALPAEVVNPLLENLLHVRELGNLPSIEWLIKDEVPKRGLVTLFGASGVGKSFIALDMAMRLSTSVKVLYVASEGEWGYQQRVAAWEKHHRMEGGNLHFLMQVVALLDPKDLRQFTDLVRMLKPDLIIIDTLAHSMLPGDENNTRDMGLFLKAAKRIQKESQCAVILVHHTGKEGRAERGSSALRGASDVMIRLSDEDQVICIECSKSKDAQKFPTRYVRLLPVKLDNDLEAPVVVPAEKVIQTKTDPLSPKQQKVVDLLGMKAVETGLTVLDLENVTNFSRGELYRVLSTLEKLGHVQKVGSSFSLTDAGRNRVSKSQGAITEDDSHDSD